MGTGTVVPDPERASSCHWIGEGETSVVVDCGAGALQGLARARLPWGDLDHLLISHFHADHIAEIPSLLFALRHALDPPRTRPLTVWGPVGTARLFRLWARAFGDWLLDPGFPLDLNEIEPGESDRLDALRIAAASTPHTTESVAFRFEGGGGTIGYTGDTGPSEELAEFFAGVDLLLAECSLPDEIAIDSHLSPASLARLATDTGVERLVVTHVYPQLQRLDVPALIRAAGYAGTIVMARDGLELSA